MMVDTFHVLPRNLEEQPFGVIYDDNPSHFCPGCETHWECTTPGDCALNEALCDNCDNLDVRTRLGGKWID